MTLLRDTPSPHVPPPPSPSWLPTLQCPEVRVPGLPSAHPAAPTLAWQRNQLPAAVMPPEAQTPLPYLPPPCPQGSPPSPTAGQGGAVFLPPSLPTQADPCSHHPSHLSPLSPSLLQGGGPGPMLHVCCAPPIHPRPLSLRGSARHAAAVRQADISTEVSPVPSPSPP